MYKRALGAALAMSLPLACSPGPHHATEQRLPAAVQEVLINTHKPELLRLAVEPITPEVTLRVGNLTVSFAFAGSHDKDTSAKQFTDALDYMKTTADSSSTVQLPTNNGASKDIANLSTRNESIYVIEHNVGQPGGQTITQPGAETVSILSAGDPSGEAKYTEACQAVVNVTVPNAKDPLDNSVAQEAYCNGMGKAYAASRAGVPYPNYQVMLSTAPAVRNAHDGYTLDIPIVDGSTYAAIAQGQIVNQIGIHLQ